MKLLLALLVPAAFLAPNVTGTALPATVRTLENDSTPHLRADLRAFVDARRSEFDTIPEERRAELASFGALVRQALDADGTADLTFVCTHNSRRSHLAQVWAQTAALHLGIEGITAYSGGTEATACNPRTVAAMKRAGFEVTQTTQADNPIYHVRYAERVPAVTCFSKVYDAPPNPSRDFYAVMTCTSADEACPIVPGASARVSLPYEDPKAFDGTAREAEAYDERCRQIAREMLYALTEAKADAR